MELVNIAFFAKANQSSTSQWSKPNEANIVLRNNDLKFAMHTDKSDNEWWLCELPFLINCRKVVVHNRRDDRFFHVSKNINIFISNNNEQWSLVYDKGKIFGYDENALSIDLNLDKKIRYIKITNNDYIHLSQVEIFVNKADNKDISLVTDRQDGLAQRLLGIMQGWAVAQYCGFDFKFTWINNKDGNIFHDVLRVEYMFSASFIENYYTNLETLSDNNQTLNFGGIYSTPPAYWIIPNTDSIDFRKIYDSISFSNEINDAKKLARAIFFKKISKNSSLIAIHIRAGDIVYGSHRNTQQFIGKVLQYPFIFEIIEQSGKNILLVGQDYETAMAIKSKYHNVTLIQEYYPHDFTSIQKIFFDIEIMSFCDILYGGNSGPIDMAGRIANKKVINPHYQQSTEDKLAVLRKYLLDERYLSYNIPKQNIAYACSAYLYYGFNKESVYNLVKINNLARLLDKENKLYNLIDLFLQYRASLYIVAEENVKNYINNYGLSTQPISGFNRLYSKDWAEFTSTSNRVGYLTDLKERVTKNDNLPYAELIVGMSEYYLGNYEKAKSYFLSFQEKTKNSDVSVVLQDFLRSNGL